MILPALFAQTIPDAEKLGSASAPYLLGVGLVAVTTALLVVLRVGRQDIKQLIADHALELATKRAEFLKERVEERTEFLKERKEERDAFRESLTDVNQLMREGLNEIKDELSLMREQVHGLELRVSEVAPLAPQRVHPGK